MITVNELFSGIGAFRKALERLNIPHEIVGISEIDKYAIMAYEVIYGKTRNYGDISKVEKLDYADLWTYGFPCQDISAAGQQKGIIKGETRSGLLYEVERLLINAVNDGTAPKYLIMENVKALCSCKFKDQFKEWIKTLDNLGYETYYQLLNAADYGIPQKRERVFAVSIRKDIDNGYGFSFPEKQPLAHYMDYYLEEKPDEKYYLTDEQVAGFELQTKHAIENGLGYRFAPIDREKRVITTLTTREGSRSTDVFIKEECDEL